MDKKGAIHLREIRRSDLAAINRWRNDHELVDCLGAPFRFVGAEVDERWFDSYLAARANTVRLAIVPDGCEEPVGVVYLLQIDWLNRSAEYAIQIGAPQGRGSGAGTRATELILEHAFFDLNLRRVYLEVLKDNERARGLYRKMGFVEEGVARQAVFKNGAYRDLVHMAILAGEYRPGASEEGACR